MYDSILALCERVVYQHSFTGCAEARGQPSFNCPFGLYRPDGWVTIACPNDGSGGARADHGANDWSRIAHSSRCRARSRASSSTAWSRGRVRTRPSSRAAGRPCAFGPVHTVADIFADPTSGAQHAGQSAASGLSALRCRGYARSPVQTPGGVRRASYHGEHTLEVLRRRLLEATCARRAARPVLRTRPAGGSVSPAQIPRPEADSAAGAVDTTAQSRLPLRSADALPAARDDVPGAAASAQARTRGGTLYAYTIIHNAGGV
jgi:hypothetical protein